MAFTKTSRRAGFSPQAGKTWCPCVLTGKGVQGGAVCEILQRHCGCSRQAGRGATGVSWPMDQCGWMAWDEDHLAWGFRHSTGAGEAGEAWASFNTFATEDAGIPNRRAVSRRPTPWAFNWRISSRRSARVDGRPNRTPRPLVARRPAFAHSGISSQRA